MDSLLELQQILKADIGMVNNIIIDLSKERKAKLIPIISEYLIDTAGKRVRPLLTLACAKLFNYTGELHVLLAGAVEFIHTATLLHDDVIDRGKIRRGRPSINALWGDKPSILIGDYLFSKSFQLMIGTNSINALSILAKVSSIICEAELWQCDIVNDVLMTQDKYMELITGKTAVLFAGACKVGGVIAMENNSNSGGGVNDVYDKIYDHLYNYGVNTGIIFQIIDDLLDYTSNIDDLGKETMHDIKEGKITLPFIIMYKMADELEKNTLKNILLIVNSTDGNKKNGDNEYNEYNECINKIKVIFNKYDVGNAVLSIAKQYVEKSQKELDKILFFTENYPKFKINQSLYDLLYKIPDNIVMRKF